MAAFVMACRLARRGRGGSAAAGDKRPAPCAVPCAAPDDDSDAHDAPPGWRKRANLGMYTILDKIF